MKLPFKRKDAREVRFERQLQEFKDLNRGDRFDNSALEIMKCFGDDTAVTGFDAHYIYHPAWAARIVRDIAPNVHVDISSTLHFCTILSAFMDIEFYDYRPATLQLDRLKSLSADLTNLPFTSGSVQSLSCMHTIEHIGLGRYGDLLDPDGDLKALSELKRVCARSGNLLIVVPVGARKIMYNAHRIYAPGDLVDLMDGFRLLDFSLIDDEGRYTQNASMDLAAKQRYGCGCYWFVKE